MKLNGLLVIFVIFLIGFDGGKADESELLCQYEESELTGYTCILKVTNQDGDEFTSIAGNHLPMLNFTDADVVSVVASQQNTPNVPSIICTWFSNLQRLYISDSKVRQLSAKAFADCKNIEHISLELNDIKFIDEKVFAASTKLQTLDFYGNDIFEVADGVFAGLPLTYLNLKENQLSSFSVSWFGEEHSNSLKYLHLSSNHISMLASEALSGFSNLLELNLADNPLYHIAEDAFKGLSSLTILNLNECQLTTLRTSWFDDLPQLSRFSVNNNQLNSLPVGIFKNLTTLLLAGNNLQVIKADSFKNLEHLVTLDLKNNSVFAIDADIYDNSSSLYNLQLENNMCASTNLANVRENREYFREQLKKCFDFFENGFLECSYVERPGLSYICTLSVLNRNGKEFKEVSGEHVRGNSNSSVNRVEGAEQMTTIIPRIICGQFVNLKELFLSQSGIQELTRAGLAGCTSLEYMNLEGNDIKVIPANLFGGSLNGDGTFLDINKELLPKLLDLDLSFNRINLVEPNAFQSIDQLVHLNLGNNQLDVYDPTTWFGTNFTENNLKTLLLDYNRITALPNKGFAVFKHLQVLSLGNNQLEVIPDDAFDDLFNISKLDLDNCGIAAIKNAWMKDMENLKTIHISNNKIQELPKEIFKGVVSVYAANNQIKVIDGASFKAKNSLVTLDVESNEVDAFDPDLYENAEKLFTVKMMSNTCASVNVIDMQLNREFHREELSKCFENFRNLGN